MLCVCLYNILRHYYSAAYQDTARKLTKYTSMPVVVVAGGLGDLGRLITDALVDTGKHEVYVLSRKVPLFVPHSSQTHALY